MTRSESAAPVPAGADLDGLREVSAVCTACDLYRDATKLSPARDRLGLG